MRGTPSGLRVPWNLENSIEIKLGQYQNPTEIDAILSRKNQAAQVLFSQNCRLPRSPWTNWRIVMALVSKTDSITSLPDEPLAAECATEGSSIHFQLNRN